MAAGSETSIVLAATWLHDIIDDKVTSNPAQARREVAELLIQTGTQLCQSRCYFEEIMDRQSFSKNLKERQSLSLKGKLACRIEPIGCLRHQLVHRSHAYYGGSRGN